jgi:hypothetical protein
MKETPFEYVGRTLMNLVLTYERDPRYKKLLSELELDLSLPLLLNPIIQTEGPEVSYMVHAYRKLSQILNLDLVNGDNPATDFDSLFWKDENHMIGPVCGNCCIQTTPILYGMPGEDFDFDLFEVGGCVVSESDPVWICRKCGWQI